MGFKGKTNCILFAHTRKDALVNYKANQICFPRATPCSETVKWFHSKKLSGLLGSKPSRAESADGAEIKAPIHYLPYMRACKIQNHTK